MKSLLPFLAWLPLLKDRAILRADVLAGLTGAIVVLPQGVAYATLAGMPPQYGLYAAMIPCAIAALFGSSRIMVTGPANAISLTVLALIAPLAVAESPRFILLVSTLTFMVGLWQLLLGLAKVGKLAEYVSHTVIVGFTAGAALLIINSQIGNFFGLDIPRGASVVKTWSSFFQQITSVNFATLIVGCITLIVSIAAKRWNAIVPYMLTGMIFGCVCAAILNDPVAARAVPAAQIRTVAALPGALPPISMPDFSIETFRALLLASIVMTVLAMSEAISIGQAMAKKRAETFNANQELIGQGLANLGGAFFSSYPASGSFNRTGVNLAANARTPFSAICAAGFLVLLLTFVAPLAKFLPYSAMAAILFLVAINLIDVREIKHFLADARERIVLLGTFFATLLMPLEWAIFLGVALSLIVKTR